MVLNAKPERKDAVIVKAINNVLFMLLVYLWLVEGYQFLNIRGWLNK